MERSASAFADFCPQRIFKRSFNWVWERRLSAAASLRRQSATLRPLQRIIRKVPLPRRPFIGLESAPTSKAENLIAQTGGRGSAEEIPRKRMGQEIFCVVELIAEISCV